MPIARVYLIENHGRGYVGSTTDTIQRRLARHRLAKLHYQEGKSKKRCSSIILLDGNETIRLLEEFEYTTREEIQKREQHYIDTLQNLVNKYRAIKPLVRPPRPCRKTYHQERWRRNKMFVEFLRDFNL
jgi:predicted GIY-YIG superfamily endonuclease